MRTLSQGGFESLKRSVKRHEGYRRMPYLDSVGLWTVGYGRLIDPDLLVEVANMRTVGDVLRHYSNPDNHERWLLEDLGTAVSDASVYLGPVEDALSEPQYEVVCEMCYQMGLTKVKRFKRFRAALETGDIRWAGQEMLDSLWFRQTATRVLNLRDKLLEG